MALPKSAQKQLADAEKLHAEVYKDAEKPELKEVTDEPEQSDEQGEVSSSTESGETTDAGDAGQGEELQQVRGETSENEGDDPAKWKHKYDVLKGKYDAEVPRLQRENQAIRSQMGELQAQMEQVLESQLQQRPSEEQTTEKLLSDAEIEDYGEDMIAVVKKAAKEEFQPMLESLRRENESLRQVLGGMQQQTVMSTRQQMMDELDSSVPNWREINSNQEFLGWLENVDPYSGQRKIDLLRSAFENNNTARVTAFFKGYLNENAAFTSKVQEPSSGDQPQVSLDTLVAPGRPSDGNVDRAQEGNNANGRTWSSQEIAGFYRDVQRGVYRNKPDERERLERDIFLAQEQGRIVT